MFQEAMRIAGVPEELQERMLRELATTAETITRSNPISLWKAANASR